MNFPRDWQPPIWPIFTILALLVLASCMAVKQTLFG